MDPVNRNIAPLLTVLQGKFSPEEPSDLFEAVLQAAVHGWMEGHLSATGHEARRRPTEQTPSRPYPPREIAQLRAIVAGVSDLFSAGEQPAAMMCAAALGWRAGRQAGLECPGCALQNAEPPLARAMADTPPKDQKSIFEHPLVTAVLGAGILALGGWIVTSSDFGVGWLVAIGVWLLLGLVLFDRSRRGKRSRWHSIGWAAGALILAPGVLVLGDPGKETVTVPDVVGKQLDVARQEITGAGLPIGPTTRKCSQRPPDVVADQRPDAGVEVPPNTKVLLTALAGPSSRISSPSSGATIRRTFNVRGTACVIAPDQLWLAIGTQGGLSPKLPPLQLSADGEFRSAITQPKRIPGGMSVVLLRVRPSGQRRIQQWIKAGQRPPHRYPPLTSIVGSTTLDTVEVR